MALSVIIIFTWFFVLIIRGWIYYKNTNEYVSIFQYFHMCISLDMRVFKSLFYFKFLKNELIYNVLTAIAFIIMGFLFIDSILV